MTKLRHSAKEAGAIDKRIGQKIQDLRISLGVTRQELAEKIGVTHQQLQKYEQGSNRVTASRLVHLAGVLQVSVTYFFEDYFQNADFRQMKNQRLCMEVMRNFLRISRDDQREAIRQMVKTMAESVDS